MRELVVTDERDATPFVAQWQALAVEASNPYCAPEWMLSWWRRAAPPRCELRVVVVLDEEVVVGIAPLFADRRLRGTVRYRVLGAGTSARVDLLARRGREREVARRVASILAVTSPRPHAFVFEGIPAESGWGAAVAANWPRVEPHPR